MELSQQFSLQNYNSFKVNTISPTIYFLKTLADLSQLPDLSSTPYYILGDGSNTLFIDRYAPIIIKPELKGIKVSETKDYFIVKVGAGENWHDLVCYCLSRGIYGLENLALIPGSVGAAPVQNIGAYGVEFSDFCYKINWFEFSSKEITSLNTKDCDFEYRNSIFKQSLYNQGIITEVVLKLPKMWKPNLSYAGLNELDKNQTPSQIMNKVIRLREAKLPSPSVLPNAGSFFKNPIVSIKKLKSLKNKYPAIPFYPQDKDKVKLAAGWLIEQTGLKGFRQNGVGVHKQQALVLVNYNSNDGNDIVVLAKYVQHKVIKMFDILITPEVRIVTNEGEQDFNDLIN